MEGREEGGNERGRKEREKASNGEGSKKGNDIFCQSSLISLITTFILLFHLPLSK